MSENSEKLQEMLQKELLKMLQNGSSQICVKLFENCTFSGTFYSPLVSDFFLKQLDITDKTDKSMIFNEKVSAATLTGNVDSLERPTIGVYDKGSITSLTDKVKVANASMGISDKAKTTKKSYPKFK